MSRSLLTASRSLTGAEAVFTLRGRAD